MQWKKGAVKGHQTLEGLPREGGGGGKCGTLLVQVWNTDRFHLPGIAGGTFCLVAENRARQGLTQTPTHG